MGRDPTTTSLSSVNRAALGSRFLLSERCGETAHVTELSEYHEVVPLVIGTRGCGDITCLVPAVGKLCLRSDLVCPPRVISFTDLCKARVWIQCLPSGVALFSVLLVSALVSAFQFIPLGPAGSPGRPHMGTSQDRAEHADPGLALRPGAPASSRASSLRAAAWTLV